MAKITPELKGSLVSQPDTFPTQQLASHKDWIDEIKSLAGSWEDFPSLEEIRSSAGKDIPRESW